MKEKSCFQLETWVFLSLLAPLPPRLGEKIAARAAAAARGRFAQPTLVIGRQGLPTITLVYQYRLCYTQCRCIVPAHYRVQLYSVDQSQEPPVVRIPSARRVPRGGSGGAGKAGYQTMSFGKLFLIGA